jgi:Viral BACON domain
MRRLIGIGTSGCLLATFLILPACEQTAITNESIQSSPPVVSGFNGLSVSHDISLELVAGESTASDIILQAGQNVANGQVNFKILEVFLINKGWSDNASPDTYYTQTTGLSGPMTTVLRSTVNPSLINPRLEPQVLTVSANSSQKITLTVDTSDAVVPGEYWLMLEGYIGELRWFSGTIILNISALSTSRITIPSTPSTQAETPINPWPTVWPSETIVDSDGITRTVLVHPDPPMISLGESTMVFITGNKVNPAIQTRSISANYDDISWAITTDVPWLVVSPTRGMASPANKLISVAVDVISLAPGNYVGHINITVDAFNSPRVIPVQLTIQH